MERVLDELADLPAWYADAVEGETSALTEYQRQAILRWAGRDLARLGRMLRVGSYLMLRELGRGGMGKVYQGFDLDKSRYVAIKRTHSSDRDNRRRFRRECKILKKLKHPGIATFHEAHKVGKADWLILEFLNGESLDREVQSRPSVPWREAAGWAVDLLAALAYIRVKEVTHRDIKPANVMLHRTAAGARAKLVDLGLAKSLAATGDAETLSAAVTGTGQLVGTYAFMSPEQFNGVATPASDVYCLGGTLYFALTGKLPFQGRDIVSWCVAHQTGPRPSARAHRPDVPEEMDKLIQSMLAKEPDHRGNPTQLRAAFQRLLDHTPAAAPRKPVHATPAPPTRSRAGVPAVPRAPVRLTEDEPGVFSAFGRLVRAGWQGMFSRDNDSVFAQAWRSEASDAWRTLQRRLVWPLALALVAALLAGAAWLFAPMFP